jgi:hypothetical protein
MPIQAVKMQGIRGMPAFIPEKELTTNNELAYCLYSSFNSLFGSVTLTNIE